MSEHANLIYVTDAEFAEKVLQAQLPVLVDFWAEWCGPCKRLGPVLEKIAPAYDGKLIIAKMDVDSNPNTPTQYNVRGIPNLVLIRNGELVEQQAGLMNESQLKDWIDSKLFL